MRLAFQACCVGAVFFGATGFSLGQSVVELPLDADNCAIHHALSPQTSGTCGFYANGRARGIVLRIDDALKSAGNSQASNDSTSQQPIAPTVRVAAASPARPTRTDATSQHNHRGAAKSENGYFVQFAFDSAKLEPQFQEHLNRLSDVLKVQAMATACLKVIGHTDTVGDAGYNLKLSEQRAKTVVAYLQKNKEIPASRVSTEAAGETRPLPDIKGDDALNRRVEFATKESLDGC
ncbi:MAG: OmpA family protein [Rhodobacteraceae bacterium]|nr:OmpA family protein [Paracoccaceae bacterium]